MGSLQIAHELVQALLVLSLGQAGQMGVESRDGRTLVSEIDLDLAQVLALFQKMRGVGVAQSMGMGVFFDAAGLEGQTEGALECGAAHRFGGGGSALAVVAFGREEQRGMAMGLPELAQQFERALRQGDVAIAIAFGAANVQEHPFGIDVADLQAQAFSQAQAAGVKGGQTDPMIQGGHRRENFANFDGGEDDRQFELRIGADQLDFGGPDLLEGFFPEEFDRAESLRGSLAGDFFDGLEVDEILAEFFDGNQLGGFLVELAELTHARQVRGDGPGAEGHEEQIVLEAI